MASCNFSDDSACKYLDAVPAVQGVRVMQGAGERNCGLVFGTVPEHSAESQCSRLVGRWFHTGGCSDVTYGPRRKGVI